jgi:prolipoprotein diacylglyceryltransferase
VIGAAAVGGFIGGRLLYLVEDPFELGAHWADPNSSEYAVTNSGMS